MYVGHAYKYVCSLMMLDLYLSLLSMVELKGNATLTQS